MLAEMLTAILMRSQGNENEVLGAGVKAILAVKWQRTWLNCVVPRALWWQNMR
jgi:hypothetical protein